MNINSAYPSRFLAADDLQGKAVQVTIQDAGIEAIGQGADMDHKIVLTFAGKKKQMVCNKTNARTIAELYGDDTDQWLGKPIIIAPREVEFQGNMVWALRVSRQKPVQGGSGAGQTQPQTSGRADPSPFQGKPVAGPDGQAFPPSSDESDCPF